MKAITLFLSGAVRAALLLGLSGSCSAQGTGSSVSGIVTVDDKPAPRMGFSLLNSAREPVARGVTDDEGHFLITGVPTGNYTFEAQSPAFIMSPSASGRMQQTLVVGESSVEGVEMRLIRGAVITGRVAGPDGKPIVGEQLQLTSVDRKPFQVSRSLVSGRTDDRGIYRFYGVSPGRYLVGISASRGQSVYSVMQNQQVFHPNAKTTEEATIVEVAEAEEKTEIDITLGVRAYGVEVSGRVVDDQTGMPVTGASVYYGIVAANSRGSQQMQSMAFGGASDKTGWFSVAGVPPGHYSAFVRGPSSYSDPVAFDVSESTVTNLELRMRAGVSISGVVVLNEINDPSVLARLSNLRIVIRPITDGRSLMVTSAEVNPDGSFQLGAAPGASRIMVSSYSNGPREYPVLRVQQGGRMLDDATINVPPQGITEPVTVVIAYGNGSIIGTVRSPDGGSLSGLSMVVVVKWLGKQQGDASTRSADVDQRGSFLIDNLAPGTYEIILYRTVPPRLEKGVSQTVTVTNGSVTRVTIDLNKTQ